MSRVIAIVMDSVGIGQAPDAEAYGDSGVDTLTHVMENTEDFNIPELRRLGLGNIEGAAEGSLRLDEDRVEGCFGRMMEVSKGKDTITGHWEIMGLKTEVPFRTYPDGFPKEFMDRFEEEAGVKCIGNYPSSGTEIIEVLGDEHEETGRPIVYTSSDSVFQIAVNTEVIPLDRLYKLCEIARELLQGEWACGRVIARPYIKKDGKRVRTSDRRDYAVSPFADTVLSKVEQAGKTVYAVGKIRDIFNGSGITESVHTDNNMDGVDKTLEAMETVEEGLIFTNLVDFDSLYGHRRNPSGYGNAIMDFDKRLPEILSALREDDILMITADHGNDPTYRGTDHTREYVPILVYGRKIKKGINLGTRQTFADLGATVCDYLGAEQTGLGGSFLDELR